MTVELFGFTNLEQFNFVRCQYGHLLLPSISVMRTTGKNPMIVETSLYA